MDELSVSALPGDGGTGLATGAGRTVEVILQVHGRGSVNDLAAMLTEIPGVRAVIADDANAIA
ncbi:MAG: hypothetical protein ACR2MP_19220 [Streptosporangiaceae bacterium]